MLARIIDLPDYVTADGHLAIVDPSRNKGLPFNPVRAIWAWDVPDGCHRGGHAHYRCEQLAVAVAGSCEIEIVVPGGLRKTFRLDDPTKALYIPPLHWDTCKHFSRWCSLVVFMSTPYEPTDYIEDFRAFLAMEGKIKCRKS